MKSNPILLILCLLCLRCGGAGATPPETLRLSDLVNRPNRWRATVALKKDFKFSEGQTAHTGQEVRVIEFKERDVVVEADHDLVFGVSPNDCDLIGRCQPSVGGPDPCSTRR